MVMIEVAREYFPAILIAVLIGIVVGFLLFRPRQRVPLTDSAPVRPHMAAPKASSARFEGASRFEGRGLPSEAAAAASDVTGEILEARVHDALAHGTAVLDDFTLLKGVGPKFAQMLIARGFTRFDQLAKLTPDEIERLDSELGPFRGRITRDRIVEQAAFLARGDTDGFEQRFGKL
jgi:predicted flap endonuclease-1-like 5' DNA nuclease